MKDNHRDKHKVQNQIINFSNNQLMKFSSGWHVLYVRANHEKKIHNLLQEHELESFLPTVRKIRRYRNCKKSTSAPLFPSYVFVKLTSTLDLHRALSLKSSCSFVKCAEDDVLVTEEEINRIKLLSEIDGLEEVKVDSKPLQVGEFKLLTVSPFEGVECEVVNTNNKNKIIVRIRSIRQNITATVPLSYLA